MNDELNYGFDLTTTGVVEMIFMFSLKVLESKRVFLLLSVWETKLALCK